MYCYTHILMKFFTKLSITMTTIVSSGSHEMSHHHHRTLTFTFNLLFIFGIPFGRFNDVFMSFKIKLEFGTEYLLIKNLTYLLVNIEAWTTAWSMDDTDFGIIHTILFY